MEFDEFENDSDIREQIQQLQHTREANVRREARMMQAVGRLRPAPAASVSSNSSNAPPARQHIVRPSAGYTENAAPVSKDDRRETGGAFARLACRFWARGLSGRSHMASGPRRHVACVADGVPLVLARPWATRSMNLALIPWRRLPSQGVGQAWISVFGASDVETAPCLVAAHWWGVIGRMAGRRACARTAGPQITQRVCQPLGAPPGMCVTADF